MNVDKKENGGIKNQRKTMKDRKKKEESEIYKENKPDNPAFLEKVTPYQLPWRA